MRAVTALVAAGVLAGILAGPLAGPLAPAARAQPPVSTLREIGPALTRCWEAPAGMDGHEVTLRFSLRRDGTLIGAPRITYSRLPGDDAEARRFVASVLAALAACLPVALTDELGGAIAGRPLTIRFLATRPGAASLPRPPRLAALRPAGPCAS